MVGHPTHKKDCKMGKSNYGPISILPDLSKINEQLLYVQLYTYFSNFYPQCQCGYLKGYSTQHCFLAMTEKMKEARDNNKAYSPSLPNFRVSTAIMLSHRYSR